MHFTALGESSIVQARVDSTNGVNFIHKALLDGCAETSFKNLGCNCEEGRTVFLRQLGFSFEDDFNGSFDWDVEGKMERRKSGQCKYILGLGPQLGSMNWKRAECVLLLHLFYLV